jgi:dihydrofolate reductase
MGRLVVFNSISLDGYFTDSKSDMSFAHNTKPDPEFDAFVSGNARGGGTLLFGRITYDLMAGFWPTPAAAQAMPVVAERMNNLPKVVFSRTMDKAQWMNNQLVKNDLIGSIREMKFASDQGMAIMGAEALSPRLRRTV